MSGFITEKFWIRHTNNIELNSFQWIDIIRCLSKIALVFQSSWHSIFHMEIASSTTTTRQWTNGLESRDCEERERRNKNNGKIIIKRRSENLRIEHVNIILRVNPRSSKLDLSSTLHNRKAPHTERYHYQNHGFNHFPPSSSLHFSSSSLPESRNSDTTS